MTSTTGRSTNARGFTLLELVLVMLIVSIIAGIAAPSMRGFLLGRKGSDAAAQVLALGQYARTQAIGAGGVYRLTVDTATQTYWLTVQNGGDFAELRTEFGRRFALPDGMTARWDDADKSMAGRDYFQFLPDGRVEAQTLSLTDVTGKVFAIGCRSETEPLVLLESGTR